MTNLYLEILVKYLHFISIFTIIVMLAGENFLLKKEMTRQEIQRISVLDGIYGISSLLLLGAGFTLWFGLGKPAEFYSLNWIFHLKLGLFIVVGLLSIYPTIFFLKQRKGDKAEKVIIPSNIKMVVRIELLLLFIIPILASLMARGIGYFG